MRALGSEYLRSCFLFHSTFLSKDFTIAILTKNWVSLRIIAIFDLSHLYQFYFRKMVMLKKMFCRTKGSWRHFFLIYDILTLNKNSCIIKNWLAVHFRGEIMIFGLRSYLLRSPWEGQIQYLGYRNHHDMNFARW